MSVSSEKVRGAPRSSTRAGSTLHLYAIQLRREISLQSISNLLPPTIQHDQAKITLLRLRSIENHALCLKHCIASDQTPRRFF